jgi:glutamyl-tRNA reductase
VHAVVRALADATGLTEAEVRSVCAVHVDERAVTHVFTVAAGLDSMAVGESQIRGQVREAYRRAAEQGAVGPVLHGVLDAALRAGRRAQAVALVDRAAPNLADLGLRRLEQDGVPTAGARAVVLGAGSMARVAIATLLRRGARSVVVLSRDSARGAALVAGTPATWQPADSLEATVAETDLLVACAGAVGRLVTPQTLTVRPALVGVLDLGLPHDVDPAVADLPGVVLRRLADLAGADQADGVRLDQARQVVRAEVAAYLAAARAERVVPTVVALRAMADEVVATELERLRARVPDLDPTVRDEVQGTVRRVVRKLLHTPSVRVREESGAGAALDVESALRLLFDLGPVPDTSKVLDTSEVLDVLHREPDAGGESAIA